MTDPQLPQAVRVLVMGAHGMLDQFQRIAADLAHGAAALHEKTVGRRDLQRQIATAHLVQAEVFINLYSSVGRTRVGRWRRDRVG